MNIIRIIEDKHFENDLVCHIHNMLQRYKAGKQDLTGKNLLHKMKRETHEHQWRTMRGQHVTKEGG